MFVAALNLRLYVVFLFWNPLITPVRSSTQTEGSHFSEVQEANGGLYSNRNLSSIQDMPSFASLWKRSSPDTGTLLATSKRIVGGKVAQEYPSYGFSAGTDLCGGMLIHPDILLSAAHCEGIFLDGVMMGGTDIFGRESTYHRTALEVPHPNYDDNGFTSNDIMLVKLDTPSTAPLAAVNFDPSFPPIGTEVTAMGYGNTAEDGEASLVLLEINSNTVSFNTCNSYYGTITDATQICMLANGKDTCQGDSGGPMITSDGTVVGVVSFGDGCARDGVPSVFARTSGYADWITEGICEHSDEPPSTCGETESPTKAPVVATEQPTQAPVSTTNSPTKAPTAQTQSPTKAPVAQTQSPTNGLGAQTQSPTTALATDQTNEPTKAPAVGQTTSPINDPVAQTKTPTISPVVGSTTSEPTASQNSLPVSTGFPTPGFAQDLTPPTEDPITMFPTPSSKSSKSSKKSKKSKSEKGETSAPSTSRSPTKTPTKSPTKSPTTTAPTDTPSNSPTKSPTTTAPTESPTTRSPTTSLSTTPQSKSKSKSSKSKKKKSSESSEASPSEASARARGNLLWFLTTGQYRDKPFDINDVSIPSPRKHHYQLEQWVQYNLELRESESEEIAYSKSNKSKGSKGSKEKGLKNKKKKKKSPPGRYATIHPSVSPQSTTPSPIADVPIDASQRDKKTKGSGELPIHVLAFDAHLGITTAPSVSNVVGSKKSKGSKSKKGTQPPSLSPTMYPTVAPSTATPTNAPSTATPTDAPSTAFPVGVVGVVYDVTALPTKMPTMAPTKKGEYSKQKSSSSKKKKKTKYPTSAPTPN